MRILIDYRPALRRRTGVGEYIHQLAAALLRTRPDAADEHVTLFSSSWKDRLGDPLRADALVDRRVPVRLLNLLWHRLEWPPVEWLAGRSFDLVHSPHPLLIPSRRGARVITIHDLHFLAHQDQTRAEVRRDYVRGVRRQARRADGIIVSSRYAAAQISRLLDIPSRRIAVCPPGGPDWTPRAAPPRNGYILFLGTLEPRKNVGTLLEAYGRLLARRADAPPLVLAGHATPAAAPWLAAVASPPLAGRVTYRGYVPDADRRRLFDEALVLALPSLDEGFGLPALEAIAAGVPVVASDRGAIPEVLDGAGLLVDATDADGLSAALERVAFDEMQAATMAARGASRARHFNWNATARAVRAAYEAAAERARARSHADRG